MAKAPTDIRSLARGFTRKAVKTLAGIMMQQDAPPAARVAASTALLDRGWGKPIQGVEMSGGLRLTHEDALNELDEPGTDDQA